MKKEDDALWLHDIFIHYLEFELRDKERFTKMKSKDFTHALMLVYGTYLINQERTGRKSIT